LKTYLRELLEGGRYRDLRNDPGLFARFDARTVTGQLVAQLSDAVVNDAGAPLRT
jgi:hypothetical protein